MLLLLVPALLSARPKAAEIGSGVFVRPIQERDSVLIADQLKYGVRLNGLEEGTRLMMPQWKDTVTEGVMMLTPWIADTIKVSRPAKGSDGPVRADVEIFTVITSFDEGLFDLPPIEVVRWHPDGVVDTLRYEYQQLVVKTLPVDTATFEVHDIKGQVRYPLTWKEGLMYAGIFLGGALLIAAAVWLIVRRRRRVAAEEAARREPAHIVALRKIDRYRGEKFWEPEAQKGFYSGVTDALREYINARFGVSAMEMTTQEIFEGLKDAEIPDELRAELRSLFETADFVKFAKHAADREDNARVVPTAVRFVTSTYLAETEEEKEE